MRLLVILVGALTTLPTMAGASSSVLADYRTSTRAFLAGAGRPASPVSQPGLSVGGLGALRLSSSSAVSSFAEEPAPGAAGESSSSRGAAVKSPTKAFFLSLLLPGLGELYAGSRVRGAVFLAIEGTAWTTWGVYRGKGKDWENKYIDFQAQHWSFARYNAYRHAVWDVVGEESNAWDPSIPLAKRQQDSLTVLVGSHEYDDCCGQQMPSKDDQYEMIGKYYRFSYGWDDAAIGFSGGVPVRDSLHLLRYPNEFPAPLPNDNGVWGLNKEDWKTVYGKALVTPQADTSGGYEVHYLDLVYSANREEYSRMRGKSNDAYNVASTMTKIILFNHIVSAIDAARMARSANRNGGVVRQATTHLRMGLYRTDRDLVPMLMLWKMF